MTFARTTYCELFDKAVPNAHDAVAAEATNPVVHEETTVDEDVEVSASNRI